MYQFKGQQSLNPFSDQIILNEHIPSFSHKIDSFQDSMFESFGHNDKFLDLRKQTIVKINKNSRIQERNSKEEKFDLSQLAQKLFLMDSMFKIPKNALHPCVLAINSQNKQKTQMIIQLYKNNQDPKIINICENAAKYLKFLDFFQQSIESKQQSSKQIKVVLQQEFKNQLKMQNLQNSSILQHRQRKKSKFQHVQIREKAHSTINIFSRVQVSNTQKQFTTNCNSRYFSDNYKRFDESTNSAEKMFKKIQTPKIFQNKIPSQKNPLKIQLSSFNKLIPIVKIQDKKTHKDLNHHSFSNSSSKNKQKSLKSIKFENLEKSPRRQRNKQKNSKFEKPKKINITKNNQIKVKVIKLDIFTEKEKSLALRTVDQTNQFQKMLKMTSSRLN